MRVIVQKHDIVEGLHKLGVVPKMGLVVHSSLRSFGHVEGGAQTVVDALMEVLTHEGTLLMPSFNHGQPFRPGGPGYFHPGKTPTINGAIPNHFWQRPDVTRSLNPTHPFAAWGKHARRYTAHHHRTLTMGPDSPLGLLHADDGYCLLLGVDYHSNTFHHVVEMSTSAPCLGQRTEAYPVILPDGRHVTGRTWGWRQRSCPLTDGGRYIAAMQAVHRQLKIGNCQATLYCLRDGFSIIARLLRTGIEGRPGVFHPPCKKCPIRPRQVSQTVKSDWDTTANRLRPDSVALTY